MRRGRIAAPEPAITNSEDWEAFGIHPAQVAGWEALDFGPFEAAIAQGDGYTPQFAVDYRKLLRSTADRWKQEGSCSEEGVRWHQAGFSAKEAARWRSQGVDVEAARDRFPGSGTKSWRPASGHGKVH